MSRWVSVHNTGTQEPTQFDGMEPSLVLIITSVFDKSLKQSRVTAEAAGPEIHWLLIHCIVPSPLLSASSGHDQLTHGGGLTKATSAALKAYVQERHWAKISRIPLATASSFHIGFSCTDTDTSATYCTFTYMSCNGEHIKEQFGEGV